MQINWILLIISNRFYKSGDTMSKGQMFSPKVSLTRDINTPKNYDDQNFETVYS